LYFGKFAYIILKKSKNIFRPAFYQENSKIGKTRKPSNSSPYVRKSVSNAAFTLSLACSMKQTFYLLHKQNIARA